MAHIGEVTGRQTESETIQMATNWHTLTILDIKECKHQNVFHHYSSILYHIVLLKLGQLIVILWSVTYQSGTFRCSVYISKLRELQFRVQHLSTVAICQVAYHPGDKWVRYRINKSLGMQISVLLLLEKHCSVLVCVISYTFSHPSSCCKSPTAPWTSLHAPRTWKILLTRAAAASCSRIEPRTLWMYCESFLAFVTSSIDVCFPPKQTSAYARTDLSNQIFRRK